MICWRVETSPESWSMSGPGPDEALRKPEEQVPVGRRAVQAEPIRHECGGEDPRVLVEQCEDHRRPFDRLDGPAVGLGERNRLGRNLLGDVCGRVTHVTPPHRGSKRLSSISTAGVCS
jgi:hypothetical protein